MASTHEVYLAVVVNTLESIPSQDLLGISDVVWEHDVPLAVGRAVDIQLRYTVEGLLRHSTVEVTMIRVGHIDQKRTLSRLRHPSSILKLLDRNPVAPTLSFIFKIFNISFDLLKSLELFSIS